MNNSDELAKLLADFHSLTADELEAAGEALERLSADYCAELEAK